LSRRHGRISSASIWAVAVAAATTATARAEGPKLAPAAVANAGSPAAVEQPAVKHAAGSTNGWQLAETTNFRLWHCQAQAQAEEVLRTAERARSHVYRKWFSEAGVAWTPRCELNLYPNGQAYNEATGLPPRSPGYAQTRFEGERVIGRQIDLRGDWPELLETVLPHEVTHVVLADKFGAQPLPSWANEGIAVLSEPAANVTCHLRNLPRQRAAGLLSSMPRLLESRDYPDRHALGAFYAQSVSVVQFLAQEKGPKAFTAFLRCALRSGMAPALRRHYGMTFEELETRWAQYAFAPSGLAAKAVVANRGEVP
jgi:hypothetical protein